MGLITAMSAFIFAQLAPGADDRPGNEKNADTANRSAA
jgi:hypothetical protein